jgi:hypothetical protein
MIQQSSICYLRYSRLQVLQTSAREQRHQASQLHRFRDESIVATLEEYRTCPDYKPVKTAQPRTREWQVTTGRSLNAVGIDAVDSQDSDVTLGLVNSTSDSDDSVAPADRHVMALGLLVPPADVDLETDQKYRAAVYALSQRPAGITSSYLVCGGNHRFDDCAVLTNIAYLKDHHIKFCSFLKRVIASRLAMTALFHLTFPMGRTAAALPRHMPLTPIYRPRV